MRLDESLQEPISSPIHDALTTGEDVLSGNQQIEFTPYIRVVLPIDGFVFWMRASLLTPEKLSAHMLQSPDPVVVQGSLHYASVGQQDPDQSLVIRQVDFTSPTPVEAFGILANDVLYVGEVNTQVGAFKFTFSRRNSFYEAAKIFHYVGDAVYPAFTELLIDSLEEFDQRQVVSNSLPIWMSMFANPPASSSITINVPVFPAMLVVEDLVPPYVAVEIQERPLLLQPIPILGPRSEARQQCCDVVRLISYGLRNDEIMDLRDYVLHYSLVTGIMGIMEPPVVSDVRRTFPDLAVLAIKKQVELSVCYYQQRARDVARQLIRRAGVAVAENPFVVPS